ncbi:MAG: hypothetical protein PVG99_13465, partial [Desulfobacteraceae bacterium]
MSRGFKERSMVLRAKGSLAVLFVLGLALASAVPVWGKSHAGAYSFRKGVAWNEGGEEDLRLTLPKPVLNIVIARKQKRGAGSG